MDFSNKAAVVSRFMDKPFVLLKTKKNRFIVTLSISGFIWVLLSIFGAFGFSYVPFLSRLFYTFLFAIACLVSLLINFFVLQDRLITKWNSGSFLLWCLWILFFTGILNFLLAIIISGGEAFSIYFLIQYQFFTLSTGLVIAPVLLLINNSYISKLPLDKTFHYNKPENSYPENLIKSETIVIPSNYKSDSPEIEIAHLLYIKSEDNYLVVHLKNKDKLDKKHVRNTLSYIENSKLHPDLVRCHRGFMVNKINVKSIKRKNGKHLIVFEGFNVEIPVSRKYKDRFCL